MLGNLPDPSPQRGIFLASTAIPERLAIEGEEPAYPPLTQPKARRHPFRRGSLRLGRYQFFALIAFSASLSTAMICSSVCRFRVMAPGWEPHLSTRSTSKPMV
jgi:hypothetical protein